MKYKATKKINKKLDCDNLFVLSKHLISSKAKTVQLHNFNGHLEREWIMDAEVTNMKVMGGASGREGIILSLNNGSILKIFVDNAFPVVLVKQQQTTPVIQVDMSADREKLAVVDQYHNLYVYNLMTQ